MKITILGSGAFGYPLTFCKCEYCKEARIKKGKNIRKRASILVNDNLLIDLTPDANVSFSMYDKDMSKVEVLLQTHTHTDHFDVNLFNTIAPMYSLVTNKKLNIVASKLCLEDIQNKASTFDRINIFDKEFCEKANINTIELNHGNSIHINDYEIKAIKCNHHSALGAQIYLIKENGKTLLYATDTPPFDDETYAELEEEKIDCLLIDQNFGIKDYNYSHMSIKTIKEELTKLHSKNIINNDTKIYATHISHEGNCLHEELEKITTKQGWKVAYDGLKINL